jgi:hypothetical protein
LTNKVGIPIAIFLRRGEAQSDKIVEVIKKNTRFQYQRSGVKRYLSRGPRAIHIANRRENAGGNDVAIFSGIKKMTSEIALCRDHWKYGSKISLPHIALHRHWNSNLKLYHSGKFSMLRCSCLF